MPASPDAPDPRPRPVLTVPGESRTMLGESVRWDAARQQLTWTDIVSARVLRAGWVRQAPVRGLAEPAVWQFDDVTPLCLPDVDGHLVGLRATVVRKTDAGTVTWASAPLADGCRFNDGNLDSGGRLVVGSMHESSQPGAGALWSLGPDRCVLLREGLTIPNGIGWNADGTRIYWIDSDPGVLHVTGYDPASGELGPDLAACDLSGYGGLPDGMTVLDDDTVLVAMWDGAQVIAVDPRTGRLKRSYHLPARRPTSCAVAGPHGSHLAVTTALVGLDDAQVTDHDGRLLMIEL